MNGLALRIPGRPDAQGMGTTPEHPACAVRSGSPAGGLGIICGRGPDAMGLGRVCFMLRNSLPHVGLRSIAPFVIRPSRRAAPFFPDWLRDRAVRLNFSDARELAGQAHQDCPKSLECLLGVRVTIERAVDQANVEGR